MGAKSSPPPAPDYTGAAQAQGQSSIDAINRQATLNRVNQTSPLGSQTWSGADASGVPTDLSTNLSPAGQKLFDTTLGTSQQMGDIASTLGQQAQSALSTPFSSDPNASYGPQDKVQNALYGRYKSLLDPQWNLNTENENQNLANRGFQSGTAGYEQEQDAFNRRKADAYTGAATSAIQGGTQARQQAVQEALLQQNQPLNELNALRSMSQVQQPSFNPAGGSPAGVSQPTNYLGAAQATGQAGLDQYNAQVGQQNSLMGGLFGLGAAGIKAYPWATAATAAAG